jgi:hypothetical protein
MLKVEVAQQRLEEQKQPEWHVKHSETLKHLPSVRAHLRLRLAEESGGEVGEKNNREAKAFRVSAMTDAQRREVFATLFPRLAAPLERAWQDRVNGPYFASEWMPKAFHAPRHTGMMNKVRDEWVVSVLDELAGYDADPAWLAAWGGHMGYGGIGPSSTVLAAAIDMGGKEGEEVLEILKQSAMNQHEVGVMGQHVVNAMLRSGREEAWAYVEKMLLSAQREEGLRQSILEAAHVGHPGAFRRILGVILEEDLVRFASTVRAIDVWFGFMWDSMSVGHARSIVERVVKMLDDDKARAAGIAGKDAETAYLALWCEAHVDAQAAMEKATPLLGDKSAERRWVGVHALAKIEMLEVLPPVLKMLEDADIRVAARALDALAGAQSWDDDAEVGLLSEDGLDAAVAAAQRGMFELLERLMGRIKGKSEKFAPLVFPWGRKELAADEVGSQLVQHCPPELGERLIRVLDRLNAHGRSSAAWLICGNPGQYWQMGKKTFKPLKEPARGVLIGMLGDPAKDVRATAALLLNQEAPTPAEAARHEELLDRTASDLRTRAIERLLKLPDAGVLAAAGRLLEGPRARVMAGLDLLRGLAERGRSAEAARAMATAFAKKTAKPAKEIQAGLDAILNARSDAGITEADAFGLAKTFEPRPIPKVRKIPHDEATRAAVACIWSLDELVEANKTLEMKEINIQGEEEEFGSGQDRLLSTIGWVGRYGPQRTLEKEKDFTRCPVAGILNEWLKSRTAAMRDADGLELVRAWLMVKEVDEESWPSRKVTWPKSVSKFAPKGKSGIPAFRVGVELLLEWALRQSETDTAEYFLDQIEGAVEREDVLREGETSYDYEQKPGEYGETLSAYGWLDRYRICPANWLSIGKIENLRRLEALLRAGRDVIDRTEAKRPRKKKDEDDGDSDEDRREAMAVELDELVALWHAGDVGDDEMLRVLARSSGHSNYNGGRAADLDRVISLRKPGKQPEWEPLKYSPRLDALVEKLRTRVLEIELSRGDAQTAATPHAFSMDPSGGLDAAIPALAAMGKLKFVRGYIYNNQSKAASLSTIIQHSRPGEKDTPEAFAKAAKAAGLSEQRLVELALYQPRWAVHVEKATGWEGLEEGVLWLRAHTKERAYRIDDEQEVWEARAAELTPIPPESLADGAVDRAWFERCYARLGAKRWEVLYEAAKYASNGSGHTRARLFADAMLGDVSEKELLKRIAVKRHQDAARALGLVEMKAGDAGKKQLLARFKALQEMRRTSRKHGGSMLQASEKRAVEIGMENLAWTAGYPDPLRLQWAMEIEEFGDLAKGPVVVKVGTTSVTLTVDAEGKPEVSASKDGKALKSVPPAVKKDKRVAELTERAGALRRQVSRIRKALEQAMCRGDEFRGSELATLFGHPVLRTMLSRLVMIGSTQRGGKLIGYPDKGGKALRGVDGKIEPVKATDALRIAHPLDLLAAKSWQDWQSECFAAERVQPFKQVFREVYVPVASETAKGAKNGGDACARYAGQQVQPRQALALLGSRGWVARPEEGVQRTFHGERLTVRVEFEEGFYTPAEIDGLTLAGVRFARAGAHEPVAIKDVPARVFSEVMRDVDLVVSVAHRGGVDPEASQSTVEMRGALLRETCALLSLGNVRLEKARAIIKGTMGEYALHLGSGTIQMLPGGALWVVPVHSQHRGRVFLPFADDDPKTAEIISKALLLARDAEIRDPALLAQIRSA